MKLEDYLPANILETTWLKYEKEIREFFETNNKSFLYGQKRDNCGVIAADFAFFAQKKGLEIIRVRGEFVTNKGSFKKKDFYKEELEAMSSVGLNPNMLEDRMLFAEQNGLTERQKRIPHYWNVDSEGLIIDLSGFSQFVIAGLSKNIENSRYIPEIKNDKKLKM